MKRNIMIIGTIVTLWLISGCTATRQGTAALDGNWGRSFESARYHQILNPDAGTETIEVTGLDGEAAATNMAAYRNSFKRKTERPAVNISLSGLGGK